MNTLIKALIVDDEPRVAEALRLLLHNVCPEIDVAGICYSAIDAVKLYRQTGARILFLDIEMPGGNGFDVFEMIGHEAVVIYTTAYEQYAVKAIRHGALDYLLKPVDPDELKAAVSKALLRLEHHSKPASRNSAIIVFTSQETLILEKENLLYLRANGRYTELFFKNGSQYTMCKNIGDYEDELKADRFFRIHRSYLVNCRHVVKIQSSDSGFAVMSNGMEIEISKRKKTEFLKFLE